MSNRKQMDSLIVEFARNAVSVVDLRMGSSGHGSSISNTNQKVEFFDAANLSTNLRTAIDASNSRRPIAATVCLPRSIACVRVVELPPMGHREVIAAVDLELEAAFGDDRDQYVSDFVSVESTGKTPQFAIIYSLPKRILEAVQGAFNQNQITVNQITLSEFAYGDLARTSDLVHMLAMRENRLDAVICYRNLVVQSQSLSFDPKSPSDFTHVRGTLRRLQASLPESMQALEPSLQLVRIHSPFDNQNNGPSCFELSLVSSCTSDGFSIEDSTLASLFTRYNRSPNQSIDFAHPKKAVASVLSRRTLSAVLLAAAIMAGVAFWSMKQYETFQLADQVKSYKQKLAETDKKIAALNGTVEAATKLAQWDEGNVNWKDQIGAISKQVAKSDDLYLVRLQMDNRNFWERKPLTRLEGRSKSTQSILRLTQALAAENPSFSIQPNGIEPNSVDPEFNSQFRIEIEEAFQSPDKEPNKDGDK